MATPVLIDTDMGIDDAVAIALGLCAEQVSVVGIASVAGNVSLEQATCNAGRLLAALGTRVPLAKGLSQPDVDLKDASHVFGPDGLGNLDLSVPADFEPGGYLDLYEEVINTHGESLTILAIGPLTNLAAMMKDRPGLLARAGQIIVMGGAVWCPGNVTPYAEFNFYRDPGAAAMVVSSGLPVTVVPLDVTRQVAMDESHTARLSRSGTRGGNLLARMIQFPLEHHQEAGPGTFLVHDALALAVLIWPDLFMRAKMALDVTLSGPRAGQTKPVVAKDKNRQVRVVVSVKAVDFLENLLEELCHERFVV